MSPMNAMMDPVAGCCQLALPSAGWNTVMQCKNKAVFVLLLLVSMGNGAGCILIKDARVGMERWLRS